MERFLALMRSIAFRTSKEGREELQRAYSAALEVLAKYGETLCRLGGVQPPSAEHAAVAAATAVTLFEYLLLAAEDRETIAEIVSRVDDILLLPLAVRLRAIEGEQGG